MHRPSSVTLHFPVRATQLAKSKLGLTSNTSIKNAAQTKVYECCVTEMKATAKVMAGLVSLASLRCENHAGLREKNG